MESQIIFLAGCDDVKIINEILFYYFLQSNHRPLWFHQDFPIESNDTMMECLRNVSISQKFLLILNRKYGLPYRNNKHSIIEEEFLTAYKKKIPILIFMLDVTYIQSKMYHELEKKGLCPTEHFLSNMGFKADKELYEFVERIQHMKYYGKQKICWIEKFDSINQIISQIKAKWGI